ncbi:MULTISPECIES: helix-turn-helix domain-containing protein [Shewanella]|uniref:helix-turn-helix domain-containing protein n=1 Tax=Shewanella TaxID=22 RepID=UPI000B3452E1|nr:MULTISPECIES: transcriptional regulator [Shewanella]AYV11540.1 transcriptional regulator [Shewanella algae]QXN27437.1 transcriptional regulator [Shewanella putrefaciens]
MFPQACHLIREALEMAPFIAEINGQDDYDKALATMDTLIDDYEANKHVINMLSITIERWESSADEFAQFNQAVEEADTGIALLKTLMDQYQLGVNDLPELGTKANVSKLLNHTDGKKLTRNHIEALSKRFNLSPAMFF